MLIAVTIANLIDAHYDFERSRDGCHGVFHRRAIKKLDVSSDDGNAVVKVVTHGDDDGGG